MPLFIYYLLFFTALIICWIEHRRRAFNIYKKLGIRGPKPHFIHGNFKELHNNTVPMFTKWIREFGPIFGYFAGTRPTLVVADTELLKRVQIKDAHLFAARVEFIRGGLEANEAADVSLISPSLPITRWKEQRSLLASAFTSLKIKAMVPLMNDAIDALLDNIEQESKGGTNEFEIYQLYQRLTMDTIGRSAFGVNTDVQRNPDDPFFKSVQDIFKDQLGKWQHALTAVGFLFPEFEPIIYPIRWLQWRVIEMLGGTTIMHYQRAVARKVIEARRQNLSDPSNPWSAHDLLQAMLDANLSAEQMAKASSDLTASMTEERHPVSDDLPTKSFGSKKNHKMSDAEVVANAVLFFEAGYETTSTALAFITHILVNHQDIQDKVRAEISELLEKEGSLDYNAVNGLSYLDAVINETLRFYPPITNFVNRVASVDYHYKDIVIPAGTAVYVPVYQLHHDPNLWEEPEKFDPERFIGENKGKVNSIAWQPFGAGPRNCIGMRFALLEAKLTLARILLKYRLEPGPTTERGLDIEVEFRPVTLMPKKFLVRMVLKSEQSRFETSNALTYFLFKRIR